MQPNRPNPPDWGQLYEIAAGQGGYVTTQQAQEAGYSLPLLTHHVKQGRLQRARRGVYRLTHYPAGEHEELIVLWLWSEQAGVFSHETALSLHQLSDALPAVHHLTLPAAWSRRRLRTPPGVRLYFADVKGRDLTWAGGVPVTSPLRTHMDCMTNHVLPEFIYAARIQILQRGLANAKELQTQLAEQVPATSTNKARASRARHLSDTSRGRT
ncbi:putative transcriptional regulator of viral defense system [Archangium gephyra]|uniref:Transcriptional regulator of viral defense system n=1 Tax=Archangium gephyra TaxID=48 RepID=A0ABX9K1P2_9BACT|nr:type IV toxin-antitoxin system AbiEi family antitoxin domain-containing protein [Archangium gephyra]REG31113.1 putative transcriptional regulator of viral defense system [Archangium gephyra]